MKCHFLSDKSLVVKTCPFPPAPAAHAPDSDTSRQIALFPHDRPAPTDDERVGRIRLDALSLRRPRQCGAATGWPWNSIASSASTLSGRACSPNFGDRFQNRGGLP
jgi:hypothetical protein